MSDNYGSITVVRAHQLSQKGGPKAGSPLFHVPPEAAIEGKMQGYNRPRNPPFTSFRLLSLFFLSSTTSPLSLAMVAPVGISDIFPAPFVIYPLCILGLLIPAPVHFKSGNVGVILFIIYAASVQLILLTNSIVWRGNIGNPAPYWCDLAVFILAIAPTGMSGAFLCITRQLHKLSKAQAVRISQSEVSLSRTPVYPFSSI